MSDDARRGGGRGRGRGGRPSSAPTARQRSSSGGRRGKGKGSAKKPTAIEDEQPIESLGADVIAECAGLWAASDGAYYEVTEDWKCIRTDQKGNERTYDLTWDDSNGIILWGNTFFFDSVGRHKREDTMLWYRQTDPDMKSPAFTWHRSEGDEKPPRSQPKAKAKTKAKAKESSSRSKSPSPKPVDAQEFRVQKLGGGMNVKAGNILRVVRVEGSHIVCIVVSHDELDETRSPPRGKARPARGASSRQRLSSRGRAKAKGTKPDKGYGSDAFSQILGTWVGTKSETYEVNEDWSCTRNDKRGSITYDLAWDEENEIVLWGSTYMLDPQDVTEDTDEISWYRQNDLDKTKPIFSWIRQMPAV